MGAPEWIKDKWERGKKAASEGAEDVREVWNLEDDFVRVSKARQYLKDHKDELDDIDAIDVFRKPAAVEKQIADANEFVAEAMEAAQRINGTNLRFSQEYLGETLEEIEDSLDDLSGFTAGLLEDVVNPSTLKGKAAKKLASGQTLREMTSLSLKVKELRLNVQSLQKTLKSLVDPTLREPSNNRLLNPYLKAKGSYDRIKEIVETLQKIKRMKDRVTSLGLGD